MPRDSSPGQAVVRRGLGSMPGGHLVGHGGPAWVGLGREGGIPVGRFDPRPGCIRCGNTRNALRSPSTPCKVAAVSSVNMYSSHEGSFQRVACLGSSFAPGHGGWGSSVESPHALISRLRLPWQFLALDACSIFSSERAHNMALTTPVLRNTGAVLGTPPCRP